MSSYILSPGDLCTSLLATWGLLVDLRSYIWCSVTGSGHLDIVGSDNS